MRTKVFRVLSGLLAIVFVWFLVAVDHSGRMARELFGIAFITVVFAAFAVLGTEGANRVLGLVFGVDQKDSPPK